MIDSHITDFSGRIDKLASYETYTVRETTLNKLKRLELELQELEEEIDTNGEPTDEILKLKELYKNINKKTKDLNINSIDIEKESVNDKDVPIIENFEEFKDIESRITHIEKIIGVNFKPDSSIQSTINELFRKFKLLSNDSDELHKINKIIDEINIKLEKALISRHVNTEVTEESQICSIYRNFENLKDYQEELPLILKRLESLSELHLKANNSVNIIEELDHSIHSMKIDFEKWEDSLDKLDKKLNDLNEKVKELKK